MSDDVIRRSDAIKAFTFNSKGERIPFVDCDNFPVEFPLRYIVDTLAALPPADRPQGWIPCSERLPETLGEYLITALSNPHKNRIVSAGYYNNRFKEFGTYRADASWEKWDVIAWMPLPKPWKGADNE